MAKKYLDYDGLLYFWQKIKLLFSTKAEGVKTITRSGTTFTVTRADDTTFTFTQQDNTVAKTTTTPKMNGTAAVGSETKYAAGDHVHPVDTSRAPTSHASTATTYGAGSGTNYGHVKLSDVVDSTSDEDGGIAATPLAVRAALTEAKDYADGLDTGVSDVQVNGTSVVTGGVASVPLVGANGTTGVVKNGSTVTSTSGLTASPIINGVPYYKDTNTTYTNEKLGQGFGTCSTAEDTAAKVVTLSSYELVKGGIISVLFTKATSSFTTLNVNSKGAKFVKYRDTAATASAPVSIKRPENTILKFMYDGTNYVFIGAENHNATVSYDGLMSKTDKSKLDGIDTGADVNQNAFSNVKVGSTTIAADITTDTLELAAGTNITLTPDAANDKVTIAFSGTIPTVPNNFGTVKVGTTSVVADTTSDTLELVAGSNITLTPDATNDKVTIAATDTKYSAGTSSLIMAGVDTSNRVWTAQILHNYVTESIATAQTGAATFQGTAPTSFAPTNYRKGYYWIVGTAGTYATQTCEPGDMIFAIADYASSYKAADFTVIQTNLDITSIANSEIDTILAS